MEVFTAILRGKCNRRPIILHYPTVLRENYVSGGLLVLGFYSAPSISTWRVELVARSSLTIILHYLKALFKIYFVTINS